MNKENMKHLFFLSSHISDYVCVFLTFLYYKSNKTLLHLIYDHCCNDLWLYFNEFRVLLYTVCICISAIMVLGVLVSKVNQWTFSPSSLQGNIMALYVLIT